MTRHPQRRCQYHCGACSSCFTSLAAFDAHRGGSFQDNTRVCWPEEAESRVEILREDGLCDIGFVVPTVGRILWRTPVDSPSRDLTDTGDEYGGWVA